MSLSAGYFVLSVSSLISAALGATCQPKAISLPYKNVKLSNSQEVRGVQWQIGGPNPQTIALAPSAYYYETYLWAGPGIDDSGGRCGSSYNNQAACTSYRGGLYDPSVSSSSSLSTKLNQDGHDGTKANLTLDDVKLQDNTTLPKFQFGMTAMFTNSFVIKGEMGIGKGSRLMNTLGEQQNTSSKSYSFFWGNEVTSEPRDGSLIFGGYDEALIDGPNVTAPYVSDSQQCKEGLIVSLTSLDLQSGGSTKNAWEGMQDLKVCVIASTSAIMFIPEAYYAPIESIMGFKRLALKNGTSSGYFYNTTILDPASLTYTGDMTVGINSQLKVTIPNNQLFFNERYIAPNGTVTSWAHIKQIPIVRIQPGDGMMPRLGGMFFSSAVLTTNHDKGEFSIAAASTKPAAQKLIAIDSANNCTGPVESKTTTTGNSGSEPGSNNNGNNTGNNGSIPGYVETVDKGLSVGAIVGIVIAGVAVIAAIAFFLWRRRRAAAAAALPKAYEVEAPGYQSAPPVEKYAYHVAEVSDANQAHEMFHHDPRYAPVELDSGMARPNDVPGAAPAPTNGVATRT